MIGQPGRKANLSRQLSRIALVVVLGSASGAGCPRRTHSLGPAAPIAFVGPPSVEQVIQVVNANTARVQQLQTTGATLTIAGMPSLRTSLALDRPLRFRLRAGTGLTGNELDLGSNDELCWMWARRTEPAAVYYARHEPYGRTAVAELMPVPPHWLMEALGLVELDPHASYAGPFARGSGRVEVRTSVPTPAGLLTKVLVIDDQRGYVLQQHVYDAGGQLLASALSSQYAFHSAHQVSLPHQIDIQLPPAQLAFTLQVNGYSINQLNADPGQLWSMPQVSGYPYVDVTQMAAPSAR
jgi:hypothetical protein